MVQSNPSVRQQVYYTFRGRPPLMDAAHRHNTVELNFVEKGSLTYLLGGRRVNFGPGLVLFWASIPHQLVATKGPILYQVLDLPLALFLQWQLPKLTRQLLNGSPVQEKKAELHAQDQALFRHWDKDVNLKSDNEADSETALLEIQARLRRLENSLIKQQEAVTSQKVPPLRGDSLRRVELMACFIADHYTESLRVKDVADAAGLHPEYAMNLFRKISGATLVEQITQHRVSHAQRLLLTSDSKVLEIGLESGFGSESNFYTAFKKYCGVNPRDYRASIRAASLADKVARSAPK